MSYKPHVKKTSAFGGPSGVAKVLTKAGVNKVKVVLDDKEYFITDYPDYLTSGDWNIRLSENKDKVLSAYPANGMLKVKVSKFAAKDGEEPAPKTKVTDEYSYQYFVVILEVVSPTQYKGVEIPLMLRYHFDSFTETHGGKEVEVVEITKPRSKYTPLLMDFCDASGVWEKGPMQYKANILPTLAKRIANAGKTFQVVLKDGWVTTVFASMEDETDFGEEADDDLPWEGPATVNDFVPDKEKDDDELKFEE